MKLYFCVLCLNQNKEAKQFNNGNFLFLNALTCENLLKMNFNLSFVGSNRVHLLNSNPERPNTKAHSKIVMN